MTNEEKILEILTRMQAEQAQMQATQTKMLAEQAQMQATQTKMLAEQAQMQATQTKMLAEQAQMQTTQTQILATQTKMLAEQAQMQATQTKMLAEQAQTNDRLSKLEADVSGIKVRLDVDIQKQIDQLVDGQDELYRKLTRVETLADETKERVDAIHAAVSQHSRDIIALKKVQ